MIFKVKTLKNSKPYSLFSSIIMYISTKILKNSFITIVKVEKTC